MSNRHVQNREPKVSSPDGADGAGPAVEIVVKGRHCEVPERFRRHAQEKLAKVGRFDPRVTRIDVELCKEHNPRLADVSERIELTVRTRGPVIRAEAAAADSYAALDGAWSKLEMRLRRAGERRHAHHGPHARGAAARFGASSADTPAIAEPPAETVEDRDARALGALDSQADEGPFVIREKVHEAEPMTLDQALYEMELVGHDFFLFVDAATRSPSVVYRRRGYSYGVIRLAV